jgi:L-lysine 2,3-aminomutase
VSSLAGSRYVTDPDSDELLALLKGLVDSGRHVALMAHINHWAEMETPLFKQAVKRLRSAGVTIRSQSPLLANINDSAEIWSKMWRRQVSLGIIPYYMFVERDTGSKQYFEVPLVRAYNIYKTALSQLTGLARSARGSSMSCGPGKVELLGITSIRSEKVFVLRFYKEETQTGAINCFPQNMMN